VSFVSWQFASLLAAVVPLYWLLPWRGRIYLLLAASYLFYGSWDSRFLALILTSTAVDFFCGLGIAEKRQRPGKVFLTGCAPLAWLVVSGWMDSRAAVAPWILLVAGVFPVLFTLAHEVAWRLAASRRRRFFLGLSISTNLGVLFFFKYFNFFADSATALLGLAGITPGWTTLNIILPVGISFYTFQSICYSVAVYRGETAATDDLPVFATYLSYFPQLVAGPIERSSDLLPQMQKPAVWTAGHLHEGLALMLVGFFKKMFVADNCAVLANYAFDPNTPLNTTWILIGSLAFAFQIYGDFSGYTDIARGTSQLLGIRLSRNFAFPYFALTPSEFWTRWHITLSSWFRDYVYIPLGGNRRSSVITLRNLWITMLLAGLWHGASWTFILWGAYHAALLSAYRLVPGCETWLRARNDWRVPAGWLLMFSFTLGGWVIFRCGSLEQLARWFAALGRWNAAGAVPATGPFIWLLVHIAPLLLLQLATRRSRDEARMEQWSWPARTAAFVLMFLLVATNYSPNNEFIYFQF
jgi:alginate O-acetyltransferase complex protein AlgI